MFGSNADQLPASGTSVRRPEDAQPRHHCSSACVTCFWYRPSQPNSRLIVSVAINRSEAMKQPHTEESVEHTETQQNTGNHKRPGSPDERGADRFGGTRTGA
jgi:hypothetical protein